MSILLLRLYEHIQNRAVRLSVLCAFVLTFIGLPALGQTMKTNVFDALDLVDFLGQHVEDMAVSMEEARYEAYLTQTDQVFEEDPMVMLAEEETLDHALWNVESLFKNVFNPTH